LASALGKNLVDFFFEALFEHLVSFVENDSLQCREIDISALNMIEHTTASTNKEVDAAAECSCLVLNVDSTIDSERVELVGVVLEFCKLILHLNSQLSGGTKHDSLDLATAKVTILAQILDGRQAESECLTTACQVTSDDILSVEHRVETVLLDGEKASNSAS